MITIKAPAFEAGTKIETEPMQITGELVTLEVGEGHTDKFVIHDYRGQMKVSHYATGGGIGPLGVGYDDNAEAAQATIDYLISRVGIARVLQVIADAPILSEE